MDSINEGVEAASRAKSPDRGPDYPTRIRLQLLTSFSLPIPYLAAIILDRIATDELVSLNTRAALIR